MRPGRPHERRRAESGQAPRAADDRASRRGGVRLGGALLAPDDLEDLWIYARGAAWASARAGAGELRGDLVTSYFLNSDDGFDRKFRLYVDARAGLPDMPGRPGVYLRLPLDREARDAMDLAAGLSVRIGL